MKLPLKPLVPAENLAADADAILRVKLWLTGICPMVWRRVLVPATFTPEVVDRGWSELRLPIANGRITEFDSRIRNISGKSRKLSFDRRRQKTTSAMTSDGH
jgi:hypothetical protein